MFRQGYSENDRGDKTLSGSVCPNVPREDSEYVFARILPLERRRDGGDNPGVLEGLIEDVWAAPTSC